MHHNAMPYTVQSIRLATPPAAPAQNEGIKRIIVTHIAPFIFHKAQLSIVTQLSLTNTVTVKYYVHSEKHCN